MVPGAGDDAVAGERLLLHAEVDAVMLDVHVIFFEAALIEEDAEPLAGGQPALGVLRRDALLAAAHAAPPRRFSSSSIVVAKACLPDVAPSTVALRVNVGPSYSQAAFWRKQLATGRMVRRNKHELVLM